MEKELLSLDNIIKVFGIIISLFGIVIPLYKFISEKKPKTERFKI